MQSLEIDGVWGTVNAVAAPDYGSALADVSCVAPGTCTDAGRDNLNAWTAVFSF